MSKESTTAGQPGAPLCSDRATGQSTVAASPAAMTKADVLRVAAPDNSMAPRVRAGELLEFQTGLPPRPGDGVLVQDDVGNFYFRLYRERTPGHWEAHATSDAYQTLDSQRDGLRVLGVLTAVFQRWGPGRPEGTDVFGTEAPQ